MGIVVAEWRPSLERSQLTSTPGSRGRESVILGGVQGLVPGFLLDCRLDGDARAVTFKHCRVARELLVDIDDKARRLAYAEPAEPFITRNASLQAFPKGKTAAASSGSSTSCRARLRSNQTWMKH